MNHCTKDGYEYLNTTSTCSYQPNLDSIPVGASIKLKASVPKNFVDETSNLPVNNSCEVIEGPLHLVMIGPDAHGAADNFDLVAEVGKVIKDTVHASQALLQGFRTIRWDGTSADSFRVSVMIKPKLPGTYEVALGQQAYRDADCALYKYFLGVNSDQHLYYIEQFTNGYVGDYERSFAYCFKVY